MSVKRSRLFAILLLSGSAVTLAAPQTAFAVDTAVVAPDVMAGSDPTVPDLSALHFYTSQHDQTRINAEIRLLRAKFPNWQPPSNSLAGDEHEQPLWDLFAKHDLAGLKVALAERQRVSPGWQPSAELRTKLALAETYDNLVHASDRHDYGTVVDLAASHDDLMSCASVDAIWRTAEALVRTNDEPHALEAYNYILENCTVPQERLATVQKAVALVKSTDAINHLLQMGTTRSDGTSEFADVEVNRLRQRIGEAAAGQTTTQPSQADLDRIAALARQPGGRMDAELLGWYALNRKDFAGAETWFRSAMQPAPYAKAAEGLVLSLRHTKMAEAVKLASAYADLGLPNRKIMVDTLVANLNGGKIALSPKQLGSLGAAIVADKSADAAQAFGWSRFKANDISHAQGWFKKSMAWQPNQSAAIGLMITAKRLKNETDYAKIVAQYKGSYPKVAELDTSLSPSSRPAAGGRPVTAGSRSKRAAVQVAGGGDWDQSASTIVKTYEGGQVDQALAMMDARKTTRAEPKGLSIVRGWALYNKGDWEGAKQAFTTASRNGASEDAAKGLRQIEIGYTNPRYR